MNSSQTEQELAPKEFAFESMNLQVGVRLQFITYRRIKPMQLFSTLIGYVKDDYLIVKVPLENGAPVGLVEGERVTIRVFSGMNVCSFACTVQRVFDRPLLYVHLSFPDSIQGTSLRTAMRVKVDIPARIVPAEDAAPFDCTLTNVSVNGARIESPGSLPEGGGEIMVEFALPSPLGDQEVRMSTRAAVRNVNALRRESDGATFYAYGVQFLDVDPVHYTMLQNLTYEVLLADRQNIV